MQSDSLVTDVPGAGHRGGPPWPGVALLTYAFLHASLCTSFSTCRSCGGSEGCGRPLWPEEFLAFYLVAAVVGGLAFELVTWHPGHLSQSCLAPWER